MRRKGSALEHQISNVKNRLGKPSQSAEEKDEKANQRRQILTDMEDRVGSQHTGIYGS